MHTVSCTNTVSLQLIERCNQCQLVTILQCRAQTKNELTAPNSVASCFKPRHEDCLVCLAQDFNLTLQLLYLLLHSLYLSHVGEVCLLSAVVYSAGNILTIQLHCRVTQVLYNSLFPSLEHSIFSSVGIYAIHDFVQHKLVSEVNESLQNH